VTEYYYEFRNHKMFLIRCPCHFWGKFFDISTILVNPGEVDKLKVALKTICSECDVVYSSKTWLTKMKDT